MIVGTSELEAGIAQIERATGVRPVIGGVHPGGGTRNALMSLGDGTYLELLAPDPAQAVDNDELRELRALAKPTPIGWAVSADDEAGLRSTLTGAGVAVTPAEPGSRRKPDGNVLHWVTFGYRDLQHPLAPFFILWAKPALHPSRTSPAGCRLLRVDIRDPDANELRLAVAPLGLSVTVGDAPNRAMNIALSCPKGRVVF